MARRRVLDDSEDDYSPAHSTLPLQTSHSIKPRTSRSTTTRRVKPEISNVAAKEPGSEDSEKKTARNVPKSTSQIRLAPLKSLEHRNDLTIQDDTPERSRKRVPFGPLKAASEKKILPRQKSRRAVTPEIPSSIPSDEEVDEGQASRQSQTEEIDCEESIWCGSDRDAPASDEELPSPSTFFPARRKQDNLCDIAQGMKALQIFDDEVPAPFKPLSIIPRQEPSRQANASDKENENAIDSHSPPRHKQQNPPKKTSLDRPATPPPAPESPGKLKSPSKLQSPSKRAPRVPTPPLRPSLDAFWTAEAVNDWNDQYSPQKPLKSPRKLFSTQPPTFDSDGLFPKVSPCKLPQSPSKRTKAEIQTRKDWDIRKHSLASSFLAELDQTIAGGKVAALSESTGGVQLVWSKTLNSTAGRANWRRETTRSHSKEDPTKMIATHKHFASIELAEKVLTYSEEAETKLINVIAHEFCHLCNFMISGVKDQPHGASFKQWGVKCSRAFGDRGINVTTKHSYEIEYKYIWRCEDEECGMEFKRHSKSIDPKRHRCGQCRANLSQIKPVPRGGAKASNQDSGKATPVNGILGMPPKATPVNGYAAYVKEHFANLKKSMPGSSHKQVMEALGKQYRDEQAAKASGTVGIDDVAKKLGNVRLDVKEVIDLD
ncbi:HMG box-containing protein C19G7.04 [Pseudocercospora fuligena]|uniref:HMG box-containing protein C19G7.04 n=1 Tax=Pseudocercospora fuligena TaxID=685502 RepID=A0A8H6RIS9_9PEZI|nr:HMG box-containing protein C19G7.04 [Pseudocercospora fuligena]